MSEEHIITDSYQRRVSYLRFSVTDRCNLHCVYCRSDGPEDFIPHEDVLRYEEIIRLVRIARSMHVNKVRLTGGEPFARRDFDKLLLGLRENFPDLNLRITSNGTLMGPHIPVLKQARINAVNLSIDSFRPETFARVTGHDLLGKVTETLDALLDAGIRTKINAVAMRGINDHDLPAFLDIIRRLPVDVRFIEFMPMGSGTVWSQNRFWSADDILRDVRKLAHIEPVPQDGFDHGPASMYTVEGCRGRLGVITALSNHFCKTCNRLRITSDGHLRTCLFSDKMYPLRGLLRNPEVTDGDIAAEIRRAITEKSIGNELLKARRGRAVASGQMDSIGG